MTKALFLSLALMCCAAGFSQTGFIMLKKKGITVQSFYKDGHFTFQAQNGVWISGIITAIKPDSFYLTQEIIRNYFMHSDTLHVSGLRFALADVVALPTRRESIVYEDDQVVVVPGREKWLWVRNGAIFQIAGAGYAGLRTINALVHSEGFDGQHLAGIGIGVFLFLFGTFLHHHYDPYIRIGKKYQLQCIMLTGRPGQPT